MYTDNNVELAFDPNTQVFDQPRATKLVVGTDFSAHGARAVERAARIAASKGALLLIVHAQPDALRHHSDARRIAREGLHEAEDRAKAVAPGVQCETRLVYGAPHEEVLRVAQAAEAELIVIGRHGTSKLRALLGTTPERLIRSSSIPTLVVQSPARHPYRRVVAALDEPASSPSRRALRTALRIAGPKLDELRVVHAVSDDGEAMLRRAGYPDASLLAEGHRRRRSAAAALRSELGSSMRISAVTGSPHSVVLSFARRHGADLISVGTAGKNVLSRLFLGSVAETILREATCDVLVAATPEPPENSVSLGKPSPP